MVYATGHDRAFVIKKRLKTKHSQSDFSKKVTRFVKTHKISVQTDPSGNVRVSTAER